MSGIQRIGMFLGFVPREGAVFPPIMPHEIDSAALNQMPGDSNAIIGVVDRTGSEAGIKEAQEPVKRAFVAAVWCGCQEYEVTLLVFR